MKRLLRAIRYSSLGIFFAGVLTVIEGCGAKEGALAAVLLVLLQFCSGGVDTVVIPRDGNDTVLPIIIDPFTDNGNPPTFFICSADVAYDQDLAGVLFGSRVVGGGVSITTAETIEIAIGNGSMTVAIGGTGTECIHDLLSYSHAGVSAATLDLSSHSKLQLEVIANSGVLDCTLGIKQQGSAEVTIDIDSASTGFLEIDISSVSPRDKIERVRLYACNFGGVGESYEFGPMQFIE